VEVRVEVRVEVKARRMGERGGTHPPYAIRHTPVGEDPPAPGR